MGRLGADSRKSRLLTGVAAFAAIMLPDANVAFAQEDVSLPQINVTDTRLTGTGTRARSGGGAPARQGTPAGTAQPG